MSPDPIPVQSRADDPSPNLYEVVRLLRTQSDQLRGVQDTVDRFPDRMDERYHRKEVVEARLSALGDRIDNADRERAEQRASAAQLRVGLLVAVIVEGLAIIGSFVLPH